MRKLTKVGVPAVVIAALILGIWVAQTNAVRSTGTRIVTRTITGIVTDSQNRPLVGAKVYCIDSSLIDMSPITNANVISGTSASYDEPLEDIIRDPVKVALLPQSTTDSKGKFRIQKLNVVAKYFAFVSPSSGDTTHIPGGDATHVAFAPKSIAAKGLHIHMSWNFPADATYIGTTGCLSCHDGTTASDQRGTKRHIHSMTYQVPGAPTAHQDFSLYPNMTQFTDKFTMATAFSDPGVKALYFDSYDAAQAQKWLIWEDTELTTAQQNAAPLKLFLWRTAAKKYYVTFKNQVNPSDSTPVTREVIMTLGGYLRQRLILSFPPKLGAFQFITFQGFNFSSQGRNTNYFFDRSRRIYQEGGPGGGGLTNFFSYNPATPTTAKILTTPPASSASSCATCHSGGNAQHQAINATTGENLSGTVGDINGVYDMNGDGQLDDLGVNCETCHGPGSRHQTEALAVSDVVVPRNQPKPKNAKYIVNPKLIGSDRLAILCGRCHSGGSAVDNGHNYPLPGISRHEYLTQYTNPTGTTPNNNGRGVNSLWPDGIHEKGGHEGLAYSTFIKGMHYRNSRILVSCSDCHNLHGGANYRAALVDDPDDSTSPLCQKCHQRDVTQHVVDKTGSAMNGSAINCTQCHMVKTGKGGAGHPGLVLGTPNGTASDANLVYWQNDQTSHVMDMPRKFSRGVAGVPPGSIPYSTNPQPGAMPVPYTNQCGTCHDASKLQYQQPQ